MHMSRLIFDHLNTINLDYSCPYFIQFDWTFVVDNVETCSAISAKVAWLPSKGHIFVANSH